MPLGKPKWTYQRPGVRADAQCGAKHSPPGPRQPPDWPKGVPPLRKPGPPLDQVIWSPSSPNESNSTSVIIFFDALSEYPSGISVSKREPLKHGHIFGKIAKIVKIPFSNTARPRASEERGSEAPSPSKTEQRPEKLQTHLCSVWFRCRFWALRARFALRRKGTFGQGHLGHKTAHLEVMPRAGAIFCGVLPNLAVRRPPLPNMNFKQGPGPHIENP